MTLEEAIARLERVLDAHRRHGWTIDDDATAVVLATAKAVQQHNDDLAEMLTPKAVTFVPPATAYQTHI